MSHISILGRIQALFRVRRRNIYLEQHGFYDSFNDRKYARSAGVYPFFPYSLTDFLEHRKITGINILIASHRSNAIWFAHRNNQVTIGRFWHSRRHNPKIRQIDDIINYAGAPIDMLIWDSPEMPANWEKLVDLLSPRGVVVIVYENYYFAMDNGFNELGEYLNSRGMRSMEFHNPGPRHEIMSAELYYPRDNILDI